MFWLRWLLLRPLARSPYMLGAISRHNPERSGEDMGWLVIDIVVVYLFKSSVRTIHFFESLKWERRRASLTDWDIVDPGWGCPSVRLHYTFASKGISTASSDEVPFYMRWHAKTYSE